MKALLAGLVSLVIAAPAFAHQVHINGHRHFHGHRHMHHIHRHAPIIVHRHNDWVVPLVGGVIIGAVIADANAKDKEEHQVQKLVCTEWKETMQSDGTVLKERTCYQK